MHRVTLYTKPYCSLCHKAEETILGLQDRLGFLVEKIDITQDPKIFEKYQYDIPVILIDGIERFRHQVTTEELEKALAT
ncbi:glutaredoxin family protein [Candidatus Acetothermia bacterium]|nr:glutaredoxin family protein [Candidatus Acetothermia bacterium]